MSKIHPTAIVDPRAILSDDVEVGPFSIIGPNVKIGSGTKIGSNVVFHNQVEVGENNVFHDQSVIGAIAQDLHFDNLDEGKIVIGDNNVFREHFTAHLPIVKGNQTRIGNNCYFMANTHVAHDCKVGNYVIMVNFAGIAGHAEVDDYALISGLVMVHQFVRVGAYAIIGGVSKATRDVPPFTMVNGNPAMAYGLNVVGLKRSKMSPNERSAIKQAFQVLYLKDLSLSQAISQLENEFLPSLTPETPEKQRVEYFVDFIKKGKRGIVFHHSAKTATTESDIG